MCFESIHVLLPELHKLDEEKSREMIVNSQIIKNALTEAMENQFDYAVKLKCTVLLMEIWSLFPSVISKADSLNLKGYKGEQLSKSMYDVLRNGTLEKDNVFKINIISVGFTLLDRLASKNNSEAANVYRILIFALLDNYKSKKRDKTISKLLLQNFVKVFSDHPAIPLTPLIEPYLAMLADTLKGRYLLTSDEIEFLVSLSNLESIAPTDALTLLNIMMQLYYGSLFHARLLLKPIMHLIDRNRRQPWVNSVADEITKTSCQTMLMLKKDEQTAGMSARKD
jgi:hypothetical protein